MTTNLEQEARVARLTSWILIALYGWMIGSTILLNQTPFFEKDSRDYVLMAENGIFQWESLRLYRTLGYPCLVRLAQLVSSDLHWLPCLHTMLVCGASWMWYLALRANGVPVIYAGVAGFSLLFGEAFGPYERRAVLTDMAGSAWVVIAISCLLLTLPHRCSKLVWLGLILTVAAAYHTRPAKLYLVVLIPVLGMLLRQIPLVRQRITEYWLSHFCKWTACSCGPFLAYCLFRWYFVGHFGLVSFGGMNVVGLAGQLIRSDDLAALSPTSRSLAGEIIKRREQGWIEEPDMQVKWRVPLFGPRAANRQIMEEQYNAMIWKVAIPAADQRSSDVLSKNRALTQLSAETIRIHWIEYCNWVVKAYIAAWTDVLLCGWRQSFLTYLTIGLAAMLYLRHRLWKCPKPTGDRTETDSLSSILEVPAVTAIITYAAALLLVVLVEPPINRYVRHESVLMFSALSCLASWLVMRLVNANSLGRFLGLPTRQ